MTDFNSVQDYIDSLSEETKRIILEYNKIKMRITRHGSNITKPRGPVKKSDSYKKERQRMYQKKRYEKIKQEKIKNGTYKPQGRPKKNKSETSSTE